MRPGAVIAILVGLACAIAGARYAFNADAATADPRGRPEAQGRIVD